MKKTVTRISLVDIPLFTRGGVEKFINGVLDGMTGVDIKSVSINASGVSQIAVITYDVETDIDDNTPEN